MLYRKLLQQMLENRIISCCIILDPNGSIWWHYGTSHRVGVNSILDGYRFKSEWITYPDSMKLVGVKYISMLNSYPGSWVLTNTQRFGSLVLQVATNDDCFLCWLDNFQDHLKMKREIKRITDLFGKKS